MGGIYECGCRRYIDFLILLIPTHLVHICFFVASLLFVYFLNVFLFFIYIYIYIYIYTLFTIYFHTHKYAM